MQDPLCQRDHFNACCANSQTIRSSTGIWSVEANDRLKGRADFTLADMSLNTCRASYKTLPDNFELVELNLRSDYPREHGWHDKFDLVQQRLLFFALGAEEWPQILKKHFEVIKPGGYIQLLEFSPGRDFRNVFEPVFSWAGGLAVDLATKKGMDVFIAERLKDLCKEAGFEIVTEEWKRLKMPDGPVPGEPVHNVGKQWYINTCASTSSLPLKLGAIPKDEWDARQPELEKEAEEAGRRGFYMDSVVVVGRVSRPAHILPEPFSAQPD